MSEIREELIHLSEALPDEKVQQALDYLRHISGKHDEQRTTKPLAWIGIGSANNGRTDNARRVDELLAEGFGSDFRG